MSPSQYDGVLDCQTELASLLTSQYNETGKCYRLSHDFSLTSWNYGKRTDKLSLTDNGNVHFTLDGNNMTITTDGMLFSNITGAVKDLTVRLSNDLIAPFENGTDAIAALAYAVAGQNAKISHIQVKGGDHRLQASNAGGVVVVGLGCENNQPDDFMAFLGDYDHERVQLMVTQKVDGDEMEAGMTILRQLYARASKDERVACPLSDLRVGLKCGGSDGFSGITANPLVGEFSDFLVARGGTSILTEVPEMFGAETILMNRCADEGLFEQTVHLINDFKEYFLSHGEPVGENPSPGNKAGGISTLEDKALGCTQKCGRAPVSGVLEYGDRLSVKGLNLLSAPGNDLVAATALASAGCQIVLFTTGRGTPFGTFIPTMKISTNSDLFARKSNWIDFNAGKLVDGTPMEELLSKFVDKVIAVASGERTRNEENGYREISIFKNGVTL
jgi:altronate dehydratase